MIRMERFNLVTKETVKKQLKENWKTIQFEDVVKDPSVMIWRDSCLIFKIRKKWRKKKFLVSSHQNWQTKNWNLFKKETKNTWTLIWIISMAIIPMLTSRKWKNRIQSQNMFMQDACEEHYNWIQKRLMLRWMTKFQIRKEKKKISPYLNYLTLGFILIIKIIWMNVR